MRPGQRHLRLVTCQQLVEPAPQAIPSPLDLEIAFELGAAAERDHWRRQINRIITAIDTNTLEQLLAEEGDQ